MHIHEPRRRTRRRGDGDGGSSPNGAYYQQNCYYRFHRIVYSDEFLEADRRTKVTRRACRSPDEHLHRRFHSLHVYRRASPTQQPIRPSRQPRMEAQAERILDRATKFGPVSPRSPRRPVASPRTGVDTREMRQTLEEIENAVNYSQHGQLEQGNVIYAPYRTSSAHAVEEHSSATYNPYQETTTEVTGSYTPIMTRPAPHIDVSETKLQKWESHHSHGHGHHNRPLKSTGSYFPDQSSTHHSHHHHSSTKEHHHQVTDTYRNDEDAAMEMVRLNNILAGYKKEVETLEIENQRLLAELRKLRQPLEVLEHFEERIRMQKHDKIEWTAEERRIREDLAKARAEAVELKSRFDAAERLRQSQATKITTLQARIHQLDIEINQLHKQTVDADGRWQTKIRDNEGLIEQLKKLHRDLEMERQQRASDEEHIRLMKTQSEQYEKMISSLKREVGQFTAVQESENIEADMSHEIEKIRKDYARSRDALKEQFDFKVAEFYNLWLHENKNTDDLRKESAKLKVQQERYTQVMVENQQYRKEIERLEHDVLIVQRQHAMLAEQYKIEAQRWADLQKLFLDENQKSRLYGEVVVYREILQGASGDGYQTKVAEVRDTREQDYLAATVTTSHHSSHYGSISNLSNYTNTKEALETHFVGYERGSVIFYDMDEKGRFISIKNHGSRMVNFDGWHLKQITNNKFFIEYPMPHGIQLRPGKVLKIWANNQGGANNPPYEMVNENEHSWGVGADVKTFLYDPTGTEEARWVDTMSEEMSSHYEERYGGQLLKI